MGDLRSWDADSVKMITVTPWRTKGTRPFTHEMRPQMKEFVRPERISKVTYPVHKGKCPACDMLGGKGYHGLGVQHRAFCRRAR